MNPAVGRARRWSQLLALLGGLVAGTATAAQPMTVQVQVIYATNAESGIDPALAPHAQSFASFRYSAWRRLSVQMIRLSELATGSMELPGARRLDLVPQRLSPESAELRVTVSEAGRKLVASDIRLVPGGQPVLVGGFRHQDGVLFLAIQALR